MKPGQLLLRLEDADARLQAARAEAQLKGAEADISAVQSGGTQEELLNTRNALVKAQADREVAERNLRRHAALAANRRCFAGGSGCRQRKIRVADSNVHLLQEKLKGRYSQQEVGHVEAQQAEARASLQAAQEVLKNSK